MTRAIAATWYDGTQARGRAVQASIDAETLWLDDDSGQRHGIALQAVAWPERTRHGQRVAHLAQGGSLVFGDAAAFDAWRRSHGHRESWVVLAQQRWRATSAALAGLVLVAAAAYAWGIPWVAQRVVAVTPSAVEAAIGDRALEQLRAGLFGPTRTSADAQARWRSHLEVALRQAYPGGAEPWQLHFVAGGPLGANALALPGGHIVITDELLALLQGADDAVIGVLAHEHGHVRRRHGLHAVVRLGLVSAATSVALGDFSGIVAGLPAMLAHLGYARDAEREADADAAFVLLSSRRDPAAMAVLFERLAQRSPRAPGDAEGGGLPIAFASHPADDERMGFFREAARRGVIPPPVR